MIIRLKRFCYSPTETEGTLSFADGTMLATIEQPWIPNPNGAIGGLPFHSCVPDGMYKLMPWKRPNGDDVYLMYSPDLGVHQMSQNHEPGQERDLCLFHVANFAMDVEGCIGPGLYRALLYSRRTDNIERAVASSTRAMKIMNEKLGRHNQHILSIENVAGASDAT